MARLFNGSTDSIRAATPVTAAPISVSLWARTSSVTLDEDPLSIVDMSAAATQRFRVNFAGTVGGDPVRAVTNAAIAASSSGFSANTWHHVLAVFGASNSRAAYIDGGSKGTNTTSATPTGIDGITIGCRDGDTGAAAFFVGDIAEVAVYDVELSDADALSLAKGKCPKGVRSDNLVYYVSLVRAIMDYSGAVTLTETATTSVSSHPRIYY